MIYASAGWPNKSVVSKNRSLNDQRSIRIGNYALVFLLAFWRDKTPRGKRFAQTKEKKLSSLSPLRYFFSLPSFSLFLHVWRLVTAIGDHSYHCNDRNHHQRRSWCRSNSTFFFFVFFLLSLPFSRDVKYTSMHLFILRVEKGGGRETRERERREQKNRRRVSTNLIHY